MDQIINGGIPHLLEHIFKQLDTVSLIHCLRVSHAWNDLASPVFWKRAPISEENGPKLLIYAIIKRSPELVQALLDH